MGERQIWLTPLRDGGVANFCLPADASPEKCAEAASLVGEWWFRELAASAKNVPASHPPVESADVFPSERLAFEATRTTASCPSRRASKAGRA